MPQINANFNTNDRTADWLKIVCNLNNEPIRSRVAIIVDSHFKNLKKPYVEDVEYHARRHGLTWEQMYVLLLRREIPKEGYSDTDIAWAKQQSAIAIKDEEVSEAGFEVQSQSEAEVPGIKQFLERFSGKDFPSDIEIVKLSHDFDVSEDVLLNLRDCLQHKREVKPNGAS